MSRRSLIGRRRGLMLMGAPVLAAAVAVAGAPVANAAPVIQILGANFVSAQSVSVHLRYSCDPGTTTTIDVTVTDMTNPGFGNTALGVSTNTTCDSTERSTRVQANSTLGTFDVGDRVVIIAQIVETGQMVGTSADDTLQD